MACLVVRGGKVIASATNKDSKAESKDKRYNLGRSIHAELAVTLSGVDLTGGTAYIGGYTKNGQLLLSKPCSLCQQILKEAGLKYVYYHDKAGSIGSYEC